MMMKVCDREVGRSWHSVPGYPHDVECCPRDSLWSGRRSRFQGGHTRSVNWSGYIEREGLQIQSTEWLQSIHSTLSSSRKCGRQARLDYRDSVNINIFVDNYHNNDYINNMSASHGFQLVRFPGVFMLFIYFASPCRVLNTRVPSPYKLEDIRQIESVQRHFTRRLFPRNSCSE